MIRKTLLTVVILLLAITALPAQQAGEEKGPLLPEMIGLVAGYPKRLREPILTVAEHPAVLARLAKGEAVDAGAPKAVQDAAAVLAKYPEVVKTLHEDAKGMAVLGKAYKADSAKVLKQIDQEAEVESKATDAWQQRLGQDGDAIEQLQAALKGYQQANNLNAENAAVEAGVTTAQNTINVAALPTPAFSTYVMNNADVYPALADTMVGQWLNTRNSWSYDRTFHHWWDHYHRNFHEDQFFRNDEHRADRLADLARYDRKYAKDDKRWDHFNEHRKEFEHIGKLDPAPKDHKFEPGHKPESKGGTEHKARRKPEEGKHPHVKRGHFEEHHHAHHAAHSHHHHASHHRR